MFLNDESALRRGVVPCRASRGALELIAVELKSCSVAQRDESTDVETAASRGVLDMAVVEISTVVVVVSGEMSRDALLV